MELYPGDPSVSYLTSVFPSLEENTIRDYFSNCRCYWIRMGHYFEGSSLVKLFALISMALNLSVLDFHNKSALREKTIFMISKFEMGLLRTTLLRLLTIDIMERQ